MHTKVAATSVELQYFNIYLPPVVIETVAQPPAVGGHGRGLKGSGSHLQGEGGATDLGNLAVSMHPLQQRSCAVDIAIQHNVSGTMTGQNTANAAVRELQLRCPRLNAPESAQMKQPASPRPPRYTATRIMGRSPIRQHTCAGDHDQGMIGGDRCRGGGRGMSDRVARRQRARAQRPIAEARSRRPSLARRAGAALARRAGEAGRGARARRGAARAGARARGRGATSCSAAARARRLTRARGTPSTTEKAATWYCLGIIVHDASIIPRGSHIRLKLSNFILPRRPLSHAGAPAAPARS